MTPKDFLNLTARSLGYVTLALSCSCSDSHDHDHHHGDGAHDHGPVHGGELVEFGDDFAFLEFLLDPESGELTAWVHGAHVKPGLRIAQESITLQVQGEPSWELTLKAQPDPLTGEKPGDSARFQGSDERLRGVERFEAKITEVTLKEQTFQNEAFTYDLAKDPGAKH